MPTKKTTLKKKSANKLSQLKKMSASDLMDDPDLRKVIVQKLMSQPATKNLIIKSALAKLAD